MTDGISPMDIANWAMAEARTFAAPTARRGCRGGCRGCRRGASGGHRRRGEAVGLASGEGFPMVFPWFSYGFPSYNLHFPMVFLCFSYEGHDLSHQKYPGELIAIGDLILAGLRGILITHSRETYQRNNTMRWDRGIFNGSGCELDNHHL